MNVFFRRCVVMLMSFAFIFGAGGTVFAADPAEPKAVNWDAGIFIDGKMLVPLGELAKILNLSLTVDGQKSYTLSKDGLSVKLDLGDPAIQVNGKSLTMDVPPALEDGQAFVSLQFIAEALGSKVEWNEEKQHAVVQTKEGTLYIMGHPYFEWEGNHFVYMGDLENGIPQGNGTAVKGTSFYSDVWYDGPWDQGKPVNLLQDGYKIYVNGNYLKSDYPPIVRNDVVYIPLWPLLSELRMSAQPLEGVLRINHPNRIILVGSNNDLISYFSRGMDPHTSRMDYPILSEQDVLYAPVPFLTDYLDIQAAWGEDRRIDLTAGDFSKDVSWGDKNKINDAVKQLKTDLTAEVFWKQAADTLWARSLPYPKNSSEDDKFYQYEKLSVVSYNGLNVTLSNGSKTVDFEFPSLNSLTTAFFIQDPFGDYNWSEEMKDLIRRQKLQTNMTREQVLMSWGKPDNVNSYGNMEQWVYRYGYSAVQYLYFTNGVLTNAQTFK